MDICTDTGLIFQLWHIIQLLLGGYDPWDAVFDLFKIVNECGIHWDHVIPNN